MSRIKDLTGKRFGKLVVLKRGNNDKNHRCTWDCLCDCGNVINVKAAYLSSGGTTSCGCIRITSLVGKRYGRLKVISKEENTRSKGGKSHVMYLCECDCGNRLIVKAENLRSGNTQSCGCLAIDRTKEKSTKHGLTRDRLYHVWNGMKDRCYNPNSESYHNYGGRGITVCDEWRDNFQAFYDWATENGHKEYLTIDRINNDGNYEPSNCRWATNKEQQRNKRNNFILNYNEESMTLSAISEVTGINASTLRSRLEKGLSIDEAVNYQKTVLTLNYRGKEKTLIEWAKELGLNYRTIYERYRKGWTAKEILYGKEN